MSVKYTYTIGPSLMSMLKSQNLRPARDLQTTWVNLRESQSLVGLESYWIHSVLTLHPASPLSVKELVIDQSGSIRRRRSEKEKTVAQLLFLRLLYYASSTQPFDTKDWFHGKTVFLWTRGGW